MTTMQVGTLELEVLRRGAGDPILLIHDVNPISPRAVFVDMLAQHGEVIAPSHPGFGASPRPADFDTMYDLINLYHDVLDAIPSAGVSVIGFGFGGWIAAELAVAGGWKIERLVLVDPVGIKISGREQRDIVHFFNTDPAELNRRAWHDPSNRPDGVYALGWQATISDAMTDAEMISLARNWTRCACMRGSRTCSIRSSRSGCGGSPCRHWCCGARRIASSRRSTAGPMRSGYRARRSR
jgi:pimeloyl-ACP methyl ester carboxylesterase